jgi:hypothetical protein
MQAVELMVDSSPLALSLGEKGEAAARGVLVRGCHHAATELKFHP